MSSRPAPDLLSISVLCLPLLGLGWMAPYVGLNGIAALLAALHGGPVGAIGGLLFVAAGAYLWLFFGPYLVNALSWNIQVGRDVVSFNEGFRHCEIAARDLTKLSFCAISPQGWRYITFLGPQPCVITNALYSRKTFDALGATVRAWAAANGKADCIVEDAPPGALGAGGYRRRGRMAYLATYIVVLVLSGLLLGAIRGTGFPGVVSAA